MAIPPRHGAGRPGRVPSPAMARAPGAAKTTRAAAVQKTAVKKAAVTKLPPKGVLERILPVRVLDSYYQTLPSQGQQQLTQAREVFYNPVDALVGESSGGVLYTAPQNVVAIITDADYYASAPSAQLNAPPVRLDEIALTDFFQFELLVQGRVPIAVGYIDPRGQFNSGWPYLDKLFGMQRGANQSAIFVRGGEAVSMVMRTLRTGVIPDYLIDKIGYRLYGFTVAETQFDYMLMRARGRTGVTSLAAGGVVKEGA